MSQWVSSKAADGLAPSSALSAHFLRERLTCRPVTGPWGKCLWWGSATIPSHLVSSFCPPVLPHLTSVFSLSAASLRGCTIIFSYQWLCSVARGNMAMYPRLEAKTIDIHFLTVLEAGIEWSRHLLSCFLLWCLSCCKLCLLDLSSYTWSYLILSVWIFSFSLNESSHTGLRSTWIILIDI